MDVNRNGIEGADTSAAMRDRRASTREHNPILWQNCDKTITLLDLPASIAHAQGLGEPVISRMPQAQPYASTEPKSAKAKSNISQTGGHADVELVKLIEKSLETIRKEYQGPWYLWRKFLCHENAEYEDDAEALIRATDERLEKLFYSAVTEGPDSLVVDFRKGGMQALCDAWDNTEYNFRDSAFAVSACLSRLKRPTQKDKLNFRIPIRSSLVLSDCSSTDVFRNHVNWVAQEFDKSRRFDFILMDPPWDNRSVRRRSAYGTGGTEALIENMDLGRYLQLGGYVGVWITNKTAVREYVVGEGGLFESLNVSLVEEWTWVKITSSGEPVTALDGVWRKPYETLLLARAPLHQLEIAQPVPNVHKRIIVAVPDFHSRKPCLKALVEPYLPTEYQALEVFARYLVEGWTSWGNEVLKYNWEGYQYEDIRRMP